MWLSNLEVYTTSLRRRLWRQERASDNWQSSSGLTKGRIGRLCPDDSERLTFLHEVIRMICLCILLLGRFHWGVGMISVVTECPFEIRHVAWMILVNRYRSRSFCVLFYAKSTMNNENERKYGSLPAHVLPKSKCINEQIRQKEQRWRRRLTERLFHLFSRGHETEIDKSGNTDTSDRGPLGLVMGGRSGRSRQCYNEDQVMIIQREWCVMRWGGNVLSDVDSVTARHEGMTISVWIGMWTVKSIVQR